MDSHQPMTQVQMWAYKDGHSAVHCQKVTTTKEMVETLESALAILAIGRGKIRGSLTPGMICYSKYQGLDNG